MNRRLLLPLALATMMAIAPALSACSDDDDELLESADTEVIADSADEGATDETSTDSDHCCE